MSHMQKTNGRFSEISDLEQPQDHPEIEQQEHSEISSGVEQGQEHSLKGSSSDSDDIPASSPIKQHHVSLAIESRIKVNKYLRTIGETPTTKRKLQSKKYQKNKLQSITK